MIKQIRFPIFILFFYLISYYLWILVFKDIPFLQALGGNIFSMLGIIISLAWLSSTVQKSNGTDKIFWLILCCATFFYLIAEIIWFVTESIFIKEVPYPGWTDIFYLLQVICILSALIYKIIHQTKKQERVPFLFDILITIVVATTFSWHFLLAPILSSNTISMIELIVSLAYPIGDLGMLLATAFLFFSATKQNQNISMLLVFVAFLTQAAADSLYLYLLSISAYFSGSLIDPLFIVVMMLLGLSGFLHTSSEPSRESETIVARMNILQLVTPYGGVLILFFFMGLHSNETDSVTIGSGLSIMLVIIRQILMILENQRLIKQYHRKTQELEISEERYKSLFEYHPDPVYSTDLTGRFDSANKSCSTLLGVTNAKLIGKNSLTYVDPLDRARVTSELQHVFVGHPRSYETVVHGHHGKKSYMYITNIPIIVRDKLVGIFGIGKDITLNKENEQKVSYLAYHDALTGLYNRIAFEEKIHDLINNQINISSSQNISLFFMDLNQFKHVNDSLGHDVGDQLLIAVARRLHSLSESFTMIARQGGDEFTLIVENIESESKLHELANMLVIRLREPYTICGQVLHCTPSLGVSSFPMDANSFRELMKHADIAMYAAKKKCPKGAYSLYTSLQELEK
ncbi:MULTISPECIES: DUF4084 domain-containing protein [Exiguobacterium]|uniref:DUF4084 domain-containing protein n=1 Tax=Exiguobacterium TaxID=33986 RepID=UPI00047B1A98|nr:MULTISPECIES: DUF4084 domain-containing protein [Exiguobacterium]MCT4781015.1 DUF4084 domain-containing protein [Exiguobacterium soli]